MHIQASLWLPLFVCLSVAFGQEPAKDVDSLAKQVLADLTAKDQQGLEALAINEAEFKKYIWPTVAGRVAGGDIDEKKFYAMYSKGSQAALAQHLANFGGKQLEFVKATTDPAKQYKGYRVLPNPEITVRTESKEETLKLGSALLEHDGSVKVANYFRAPTAGGGTNR